MVVSDAEVGRVDEVLTVGHRHCFLETNPYSTGLSGVALPTKSVQCVGGQRMEGTTQLPVRFACCSALYLLRQKSETHPVANVLMSEHEGDNVAESVQKRERARRETRRRFEQWAHNPECHANVVSAVHNVKMSAVARRENPDLAFVGQSVFALERGRSFEAGLMADGATRLLHALHDAGVLPTPNSMFEDHRTTTNGGVIDTLDAAVVTGHTFLQNLAAKQDFTGAISSLTVRIPRGIMLPEATLIIDVLAVRCDGDRPVIEVGEIKTYADQGGHTHRSDLSTARAQMGLYVHALEITLENLGLGDSIAVAHTGFLILTYPGSNQPSIRSGEDLRFQTERARRGFEIMEASAQDMNGEYGSGDDDDPESLLDLVAHAPISFQDSCLSFCERSDICFQKALEAGDGVVLGNDVQRFLNGISLHRCDELMSGAQPVTDAERDLVACLSHQLPELP